MSDSQTFVCGRCSAEETTTSTSPVMQPSPPEGWAVMTVTTHPLVTLRICASCVRSFMSWRSRV